VLVDFSKRRLVGRGDPGGAAAHRFSLGLAVMVAAGALLVLSAPGGAVASLPTVRLAIAHVAAHCHVWRTAKRTLGASTRLAVRRGTRVVIRSDCPMDFDFAQTAGPRLMLGDRRTYAGTARVLVFRKAGLYRVTATNVQTPEEQGLVTVGQPNTLKLTIVVR
jgi:hypothetical protein